MKLLIAAVVGFMLAATSLSQDRAAKPAKEEREYARIELKGRLSMMPPLSRDPMLSIRGDLYELDLSEQKELQGEAWRKLEGEAVIVTGSLRLPRNSTEKARVLVSSLRLAKER